ncbi:MAG TPA: hypothetical protein HPP87_09080 [Planctomycetes bacterium]|nr:hypothetical protein [Planctomycetota bacterium]
MTKASGTEAEPRDNINKSRAAQAAENSLVVRALNIVRSHRPQADSANGWHGQTIP